MKSKFLKILSIAILITLSATTSEASKARIAAPYDMPIGNVCDHGGCPSFSYNSCSIKFTPDLAVIKAGISIEGQKPKAAKKKLEDAIKKTNKYLAGIDKKAKLERLGTIRASKNMNNNLPGKFDFTQYSVSEKLEIIMPVDSDIDDVLEKLPELGINRFGSRWTTGYNNNSNEQMVIYKHSNLLGQIQNMNEDCKEKAWRQFCIQQYSNNMYRGYCAMGFDKLKGNMNVTYQNIQGPQIIDEKGNMNNLYLNYPWDENKVKNTSFADSGEVSITGNSTFMLNPDFGEKKD